MISLGRNPLTGLNPLQLGAVREDSRGLRILVAIPLRGSIPCNSRSTGRLSVPLCERVAIPLRGSIPCNEGQKALEEARGAESQSPYGAQSLATQGREGAPRVLLPLGSQSPYGAQSLATLGRFEAGGEEGPAVAIPLRGSIPCNPEVNPLPPPLPGVVAIPLRGSIPCNLSGSLQSSASSCRNPLTGLNPLQRLFEAERLLREAKDRSQSPYGAQSLATL